MDKRVFLWAVLSVLGTAVIVLATFSLSARQAQTLPPAQNAPTSSANNGAATTTPSSTPSSSTTLGKMRVNDLQGWTIIDNRYQVFNQGTGSEFAEGTLTLQKNGYILNLDYPTQQASGIEGGRLIEAFSFLRKQIGNDQVLSDCGFGRPDPGSAPTPEGLRPYRVTIDTSSSENRARCGISKDRGLLWLGTYFSPTGGYLFGEYPQEKAFTLTRSIKSLDELPQANDPGISTAEKEAAKIISSIRYD